MAGIFCDSLLKNLWRDIHHRVDNKPKKRSHNVFTQENSEASKGWGTFCASRVEWLRTLASTVEEGVKRQDTTHPAFCGCIDWHSSVHGAYALLTAGRLTGESRWIDVVNSLLSPDRLAGELRSLTQGELNHEIPYGYAWFLKLAQEREKWHAKTDLLPLASFVAEKLEEWMFSLSVEEVAHHLQRREYGNLSWALLNLWEWSQWKGPGPLAEKIASFIRKRLLPLNMEIPFSSDEMTNEFFSASLQRIRAILSVLSPEDSQLSVTGSDPKKSALVPLREAHTSHSAGLNFSRAWGLWTLFQVTGHQIYREMYVDHIATHMASPQYWRDDYMKHGHWVPQFGIYAIALSMDAGAT